MLRIVVEITGETGDAQGIKELVAMDFERYGNVKIVAVEHEKEQKQQKMEGF